MPARQQEAKITLDKFLVAVQDMAKGFGRMVKAGATYFKPGEKSA